MKGSTAICGSGTHCATTPFFESLSSGFDDFRMIVQSKILIARQHDEFLSVSENSGTVLFLQNIVPDLIALSETCEVIVVAALSDRITGLFDQGTNHVEISLSWNVVRTVEQL